MTIKSQSFRRTPIDADLMEGRSSRVDWQTVLSLAFFFAAGSARRSNAVSVAGAPMAIVEDLVAPTVGRKRFLRNLVSKYNPAVDCRNPSSARCHN